MAKELKTQDLDILGQIPMRPLFPDTRPVVRVNLTGTNLVLTILAIVISVQILPASVVAAFLALAPIPLIVHNDYVAYLSLGPGGTPSTFAGYLKITYLRLFTLSDIYSAPTLLPTTNPLNGFFNSNLQPSSKVASDPREILPRRRGQRPLTAGIAPQRQVTQIGCPTSHLLLRQAFCAAVTQDHRLYLDVSCFEHHGLALFANDHAIVNETCSGEICHVHNSDGSLHLSLHPSDAAVVLAAGWGERHPLAKGGSMVRYVPREFVMIYAPRNVEEVQVVARIVEAAAWWVTAARVSIPVSAMGGANL